MLRGINVSGQKIIKMSDLQSLFEELKFKNIRTYIQSGNVIFECNKSNPNDLAKRIEEKIFQHYKFEVPAIIRHRNEITNILNNNPFITKRNEDIDKLYVTFLSDEPKSEDINKLQTITHDSDEFEISGQEIFIFCPNGYGRTKLTNNLFENKLKLKATTRNWKTIEKLSVL